MVSARDINLQFIEEIAPLIGTNDRLDFDPEKYQEFADDMQMFAERQEDSNPPLAAEELNDVLVARFEYYQAAYSLIGENDPSLFDKAADEVGKASSMGLEASTLLDAFVDACQLESDESIKAEVACVRSINVLGQEWFSEYRAFQLRTLELVNRGIEALEMNDVEALEAVILDLDNLNRDLREAEPPSEGVELFDATIDYIDAAANAFDTYIHGTNDEFDTAVNEFIEIEEDAAKIESEFLQACEDLSA
jgi:hypothetical protein